MESMIPCILKRFPRFPTAPEPHTSSYVAIGSFLYDRLFVSKKHFLFHLTQNPVPAKVRVLCSEQLWSFGSTSEEMKEKAHLAHFANSLLARRWLLIVG